MRSTSPAGPSASIIRCASRPRDRKSTRLNSSHSQISYAVFCLKKKKTFYDLLRGKTPLGAFYNNHVVVLALNASLRDCMTHVEIMRIDRWVSQRRGRVCTVEHW